MIHRIWAITLNTYREAIRQKVLYALVLFTAVLIVFSFFLGQLSLGADTKIIKDMGLASIMVLGSMMSIFMGIGLVFKEIERRTIYTILSKPVRRSEFILGKFFGLAMTIGIEVIIMSALILLVLSAYREPVDFNILKAVLLIYVELCILVASSLVFSSYSSSFMSTLFCLSFLIVGHLTDDLSQILRGQAAKLMSGDAQDVVVANTFRTFSNVLEFFSLDHFAINSFVVHGVPVPWSWIGNALMYGLCWIGLLLLLAVQMFKKKDLA